MNISNRTGQRNYNSIDLCKIIMAIFVIAIHTNPLVGCTNRALLKVNDLVVQTAVPFFFLSSGYLLGSRLDTLAYSKSNLSIVVRQLYKMVKMYLIWSVVYLPLAAYKSFISGVSVASFVVRYVKNLLFVGEHYNSWQLWYLLSTVYGLILVTAMLRLNLSRRSWIGVICGVCLLSTAMDAIVAYSGAAPTVFHGIRTVIMNTTINGRILKGVYLIPVGILLAGKKLPVKTCAILFAACYGVNFFMDSSVAGDMLQILGTIAFFGVILHIDLPDCPVYPVLRKLSTDIYLLHMYVWTFYYIIVYREKTFGWDSFAVTTLISLAIGLAHCYLAGRKKKALLKKTV